jgi:hypothetical protein
MKNQYTACLKPSLMKSSFKPQKYKKHEFLFFLNIIDNSIKKKILSIIITIFNFFLTLVHGEPFIQKLPIYVNTCLQTKNI